MEQFRGTTIVSVRRNGKVAIAGDGQVSMGNTVMKGNARKVRPLAGGKVIAGFAGGTALARTCDEMRTSPASSCLPPSIAVVDVRTRVTDPRTGDREKSGAETLSTCSHSSGERRWCK